jgi:transcriptional regulator with XRE-family HTH domain
MTTAENPLQAAIAAELRAWFARTALPQDGAADAADMHPNTLSRKLNGRSSFAVEELDSIATYLGTTLEQVLADARKAVQ